MKKLFTILTLAAAMFASCSKDPVQVTSVNLSPATLALVEGGSAKLTATVLPSDAENRAVAWKSSAEAVATVDAAGTVTAVKAGTATITATAGTKTATCAVTVTAKETEPQIKLDNAAHKTQTAHADATHTGTGFTFTSKAAWTADVKAATETRASSVPWVRLMSGTTEKYDGAAGTHTLVVALDVNYTGADRKATVTVTAGGESITVDVTHSGKKADGTVPTPPAAFVPVTDITGVAATATAGTPLTLTGTVAPSDATNKTVAWSVKSAGTTGATISGNTLNTTAAGTATVTATVTNGKTATENYTKDFTITVVAAPVTPPAPTYKISASVLTHFGSLTEGYAQPEAQTVTVKNTGTGRVTLSQPSADKHEIGALSTTTLAAGATATFTVRPKAELAAGIHDETITVGGSNGATATVNAKFTVLAPTYMISMSTPNILFGSLQEGYTQPEAQEEEITNYGTGTVTLSQPTAINYEIGTLSATTIAAGETATFTVRPKAGLTKGVYDEWIDIIGSNGATLSVSAKFTVTGIPADFDGSIDDWDDDDDDGKDVDADEQQ